MTKTSAVWTGLLASAAFAVAVPAHATEEIDVTIVSGFSPSVAGAVIPLASTVNMAGTALYQAAAIVFLAQSAGTTIALGDLLLIMITLTGASIGAPAAPGASIAILSATAVNFGVPMAGLPLIIGVDRILDMARTAVNVTGDLVACSILSDV